jgi:hypothetical protein
MRISKNLGNKYAVSRNFWLMAQVTIFDRIGGMLMRVLLASARCGFCQMSKMLFDRTLAAPQF